MEEISRLYYVNFSVKDLVEYTGGDQFIDLFLQVKGYKIYNFFNNLTNQHYVGDNSSTMQERLFNSLFGHFTYLREEDHFNYGVEGKYLDILEYGPENFYIRILPPINGYTYDQEKDEEVWISRLNAFVGDLNELNLPGYNRSRTGKGIYLNEPIRHEKICVKSKDGCYKFIFPSELTEEFIEVDSREFYSEMGKRGMQTHRENGTHVFNKAHQVKLQKAGLKSQKENGTGIYSPEVREKAFYNSRKSLRDKKVGSCHDPELQKKIREYATKVSFFNRLNESIQLIYDMFYRGTPINEQSYNYVKTNKHFSYKKLLVIPKIIPLIIVNNLILNHLKIKNIMESTNLKIKSIKRIKLDNPVKVYDLEVDHLSHNFKLAAGNFVHNCGKTTIVQKYAKANGYGYVGINGGEYSPEDILGFPVNQNGEAVNLKPDWFKKVEEESATHEKVILFIDELTTASEYVQSPLLKVIFDRMVGQRKLPSNVEIISAGNYQENLGQNFDLISPIINRFMVYNLKSVTKEDFQLFLDADFAATIDFREAPDEVEVDEKVIQEALMDFIAAKGLSLDVMNNTELSDLYRGQHTVFNPPTWRSVGRLKPLLHAAAKKGLLGSMVTKTLVNGLIGSLPDKELQGSFNGDVGETLINLLKQNPALSNLMKTAVTFKDVEWFLDSNIEKGIDGTKLQEFLEMFDKDSKILTFGEAEKLIDNFSSKLWSIKTTYLKPKLENKEIKPADSKAYISKFSEGINKVIDVLEKLAKKDDIHEHNIVKNKRKSVESVNRIG